jgi:hypothetical protein
MSNQSRLYHANVCYRGLSGGSATILGRPTFVRLLSPKAVIQSIGIEATRTAVFGQQRTSNNDLAVIDQVDIRPRGRDSLHALPYLFALALEQNLGRGIKRDRAQPPAGREATHAK